jgi:hypothetical protein
MSIRQLATLEMTANPIAERPLLLVQTDVDAVPVEDIAARRLQDLARRFSGDDGDPLSADADTTLDETDAEFEPVSLAAIEALGSHQLPDTLEDSLGDARYETGPAVPLAVIASAPSSVPALWAETDAMALPPFALEPEPEPEPFDLSDDVVPDEPESDALPSDTMLYPALEDETQVALPLEADQQPLLLADQSAPDIRLVDLIRRQQSLLDQLNRFPPPYDDAPDSNDDPGPESLASPPPLSVFEQPAPPDISAAAPHALGYATPPPLPPMERAEFPPPSAPRTAARQRDDEPNVSELSQSAPMIIQRARAERANGHRRGPAAAPTSAAPAFFAGLAVALVIAGVLLAIL